MADDEVIRRQLLIEGESGGDDRRINTLLKMFIKWCNSNSSEEERSADVIYVYLVCELSIQEAHTKITACKQKVQEAKRVRKNRQEYDALAKVIKTQPDRQETMKKLEDLDKDPPCNSKQSLQQKLEDRKKTVPRSHQFYPRITENSRRG
ncbi:THO complex subunit 7 homolog [Asterias rubens]|uniref:THO complex subunit 7 homolog n=1 Tax=Asterias rubens TaxID=7604 RepID=UPI001454EA0C|nr:THO complex subunit 7 homolog [Asterias rubens]